MRKTPTAMVLGLLLLGTALPVLAGDAYVDGYTKRDGTYVQPHWRSAPDGDRSNNWSTLGNVNPYTSQPGRKSPYDSGSGGSFGGFGSGNSGGYGNTNDNLFAPRKR